MFGWEQKDEKLFYLIEKKNEIIENSINTNLLSYSFT